MGQRSFFGVEDRLQSLGKMVDPLERLVAAIPWESFRPLLARVHEKERKSNADRERIDEVLRSARASSMSSGFGRTAWAASSSVPSHWPVPR